MPFECAAPCAVHGLRPMHCRIHRYHCLPEACMCVKTDGFGAASRSSLPINVGTVQQALCHQVATNLRASVSKREQLVLYGTGIVSDPAPSPLRLRLKDRGLFHTPDGKVLVGPLELGCTCKRDSDQSRRPHGIVSS
jgi:hypothetical protein